MAYDGLDRLIAANGIWGNGVFGYDAVDNLTYSQIGSRTLHHNIDATTNRLTGLSGSQIVGMGYYPNGNVSWRGSQSYIFDISNRLRSVPGKVIYYDYDGHGRRSWIVWADGKTQLNAYAFGNASGSTGKLLFSAHSTKGATRYVYLGDKLIAEYNNQTGVTYSHTDALGSPVARTNGSGQIVGSHTRYEPYGATADGDVPQGIGFTGHVNDPDTGLVYMQQRHYDPIASRFLSVDPVTTDAGTGSSFNRYVYGENSPYMYRDPDGRAGELFWSAPDRATLVLKYTLTGVASPVAAAAINAQVAADYSGSVSINGVNVTVTAIAVQVGADGPQVNNINVVTNTEGVTASGRSQINAIGGTQITIGATGANAANSRTASHELGHAAGAGDQYKGGVAANGATLTANVPGAANVMKDLSGQPANAQTLREILKAPTNTNSCAQGVSAANGGC